MALISCPECGKQISDAAAACPNCGYPIHKQNPSPAPTVQNPPPTISMQRRATPLSPEQKDTPRGVFFIILGCILLLCCPLGFMMAIIPGFIVIVLGIFCIKTGRGHLVGFRKGNCPYCNAEIYVNTAEAATTVTCDQCKKRSAVKAYTLETLE